MENDLKHELTLDKDNDYFRVVHAITKIESSTDPDLVKLKVLFGEASRIFSDFKISVDEENLIRGLSFNSDKNIWIPKDITEAEVLKQIQKAQELYENKVVISNLSYLAKHYKKIYMKSKMYEPFFEFNLNLINRILGSDKVAGNTDIKDRLKEIEQNLISKEKKCDEQSLEIITLRDKLDKMKTLVSESLLDQNLLKIYSDIYKDNIRDGDLIQLVVFLNLNGGKMESVKLMVNAGINKAKLKTLLGKYPTILKEEKNVTWLIYEQEKKVEEYKEEIFKKAEEVILQEENKKTIDWEKIKSKVLGK